MSYRGYDLGDVLWDILSVLGTFVAGAFMVGIAVLMIAGTVKGVQAMFAAPEETTVIEENVE